MNHVETQGRFGEKSVVTMRGLGGEDSGGGGQQGGRRAQGPGEEQEGKRTQEECSATWFAVSGFTVLGLVFQDFPKPQFSHP